MSEVTPINGKTPDPNAAKRGNQITPHQSVAYDSRLASGVLVATDDKGTPYVMLCIEGANGSFRLPIDARHAASLGQNLIRAAQTALIPDLTIAPADALSKLPKPPSRP